jgi:hypothetical protein
MEALILVATLGRPMKFARIGIMGRSTGTSNGRSPHKDHHWATELMRGQRPLKSRKPE